MGVFVKAAKTDEIPDGGGKLIEAQDRRIALLRSGDRYYALDNTCTHKGGPLAEGSIAAGEVECPWHGAHFELETGRAARPPASQGVAVYPVRVQGEDIEVEI